MTIRALDIGAATLPNLAYPPIEAFNVPVTSGLTGVFFCGDGPNAAGVNWATGNPVSVIGSPAWSDGFATFGGGAYLSLNISEAIEMSALIVVKRNNPALNAGYLGNWGTSPMGGFAFFSQTGDADLQGVASRTGVPNSTFRVDTNTIDDWTLGAVIIPNSATGRIYNETAGIDSSTAATSRALGSSTNLFLGTLPDAGYAGGNSIAMALVFNRAISVPEKNTLAAWARDYAARRGITV